MKVVANKRDAQGTGASRRLRHAGKVPGVLYGGKGDAQAIAVDHNPLFHALRKEKFHASILDMELDGASERVLLRAFQMHPYKAQVLHIDFQRVSEDQKLHMRVPLHFSGQESSPAVEDRRCSDQPRDVGSGDCLFAEGFARVRCGRSVEFDG